MAGYRDFPDTFWWRVYRAGFWLAMILFSVMAAYGLAVTYLGAPTPRLHF